MGNKTLEGIRFIGNGNTLVVGIFRTVMAGLMVWAVVGAWTGNREAARTSEKVDSLQRSLDNYVESQVRRDERQDRRIREVRTMVENYFYGSVKP